jgi:uncharacterized protein YbjT (DUF2867 family)
MRLIPLLVEQGHAVAAMTRTPEKAPALRALDGEPVVCDVYDARALTEAVVAFAPDLVLHQLTDLPDDPKRIPEVGAANNRIRREGTANLLSAARAASVSRFIAQSVAWALPHDGGAAVTDLERQVLEAQGVVLRYGQFYGPGTYHEADVPPYPAIQIDDAALRTVQLLDAPSGVLTIAEP